MLPVKIRRNLYNMPFLIIILFMIDIMLCLFYLLDHLAGSPFWKLSIIVNLDGEDSVSTWYSSVQLFCISALSAIFVYINYKKNFKNTLLVIMPIIFLLMSIDEIVQVHEWLGHKSDVLLPDGTRDNTSFSNTGVWIFVIGIPFLGFFLVWAYAIKDILLENMHNLKKIVIGMCILLFGALGMEYFTNYNGDNFIVFVVMLEEGFEMIGATTILWATYSMSSEYFQILDTKKCYTVN